MSSLENSASAPKESPNSNNSEVAIWRRLSQFKLRTLLVIMALLAVECGRSGNYIRRGLKHKNAINLTLEHGGEYEANNSAGEGLYAVNFAEAWIRIPGVHHHRIYNLDLSNDQINDDDLKEMRISDLQTLTHFNLNRNPISDESLPAIGRLPRLCSLDLDGTNITDSGISAINSCRQMERLRLSNTEIANGGLAQIKNLNLLWDLDLANTKVSDEGMEHIVQNHPHLMTLMLTGAPITDEGLKDINKLTKLRDLWLNDTSITDDSLVVLAQNTSISRLVLSNTQITGKGLMHLVRMQNLQKLHIDGTQVEAADIQNFARERYFAYGQSPSIYFGTEIGKKMGK